MRPLRASLVASLIAAAALAAAGSYSIRLTPFPTAEVADGRSQVVVSAQVFEDGRAVPDGTQVVFESNLGSFRESVVRTTGGWARATLVAGGVPGVARIKATVAVGDATGSTCEIEFVKSREELSIARETIETESTGTLVYANDSHVIEGNAPDKGVTLRYRDLEIHADVLQLDLDGFTLRAKKATVRRGRHTTLYDSLSLNLTQHTGYGLTTYPTTRPDSASIYPGGIALTEPASNGDGSVAGPRMRFGLVELGRDRDRPVTATPPADVFEMADISESPSTVGARKAVVYARREIQFHRADIFVNNTKIMKFPLFVVNLNGGSGSPLVTDEILSINDNQIALNYPHYLLLKPGLTSLLRFRTGERTGQSLSGTRGASLDYELNWSKGDDMQGGFNFSGIGRTDWTAQANQYWRMSERTTAQFTASSPTGRSMFGSGGITHSFGQYNLGLRGTQNHSFNETERLRNGFQNQQSYALFLDRNPERIPKTSFRMSYGLTASDSRSLVPAKNNSLETRTNSGAGFTARMFSDSIVLDKLSSVNGSFSATKLFGPRTIGDGLGLNGQLSLTRRFTNSTSAFLTYNFTQDGISDEIMGRHSVSLIGNYGLGNTSFRMAFTKGLGVERMNLSGEASYRLSNIWRLSYSHFVSQFAGTSLTEFYYILSYRIGWREIGLTWSNRTHRPGIQLMNVNF